MWVVYAALLLLLAQGVIPAAINRTMTIDEIILAARQQQVGVLSADSLNSPSSYGTLVEYDIMVPHGRAKRSAGSRTRRWANAQIPYTISPEYNVQERKTIENAVAEFNKHTCLQLIPRDGHSNYVHIFNGDGCWSSVGRMVDGRQLISLSSPGCLHGIRTALHEFAHAAGVIHEQSRSDRDQYITINWDNIKENKTHNFNKDENDNNYGVKYNYRSIMHYGKHTFSRDGSTTIVTLDPKYQDVIGKGEDFTSDDVKLLSRMYQCHDAVKYMGCYVDAEDRAIDGFFEDNSNNDVDVCISRCRALGFEYAGLQYTTQCFCGNEYDRYGKVEESDCSAVCPGDVTEKCGGTWRNSVYQTGYVRPDNYMGCYIDAEDRAIDEFFEDSSNNYVDFCISKCRALGFQYAGLQYATQCFCGHEYDKHGKAAESDCSAVCPGDKTEKCGGTWRNSVYKTGYVRPESYYMGCYVDAEHRAIDGFFEDIPTNDVDVCISRCRTLGFEYAGLQYTTQCFCGHEYDRHGKAAESDCSAVCPGDKTEKCGGTWRNSVYTTRVLL